MKKDLYLTMRDLILEFIYQILFAIDATFLFSPRPGIQRIDRFIIPAGGQLVCY
jgi:hypothetical protein